MRGLLLPQDVHGLIQQLRSADLQTHTHTGHMRPMALTHLSCRSLLDGPWMSVTVYGFADTPLSWSDHEHGFLLGGENFYNLVLFPDHTYRLHMATGAHDTCPP